jgi:hypothetical protein
MKTPSSLDGKQLDWVDARTIQMAHLAEVIADLQAKCEHVKLGRRQDRKRSLERLRQVNSMEEERNALLAENEKYRRAIKAMLVAASTKDMRRKLQAVAEGAMKR